MFKSKRSIFGLTIGVPWFGTTTLDQHYFLHLHFSSQLLISVGGACENVVQTT